MGVTNQLLTGMILQVEYDCSGSIFWNGLQQHLKNIDHLELYTVHEPQQKPLLPRNLTAGTWKFHGFQMDTFLFQKTYFQVPC